ncbi:MAG: hypothetical protein IPK19_16600, partial [Chloroflexi bacterium]|nr:hypothetical protein [Chloroflexota bacterium]
ETNRLIDLRPANPTTWANVGVEQLFGSFNVITTDPHPQQFRQHVYDCSPTCWRAARWRRAT